MSSTVPSYSNLSQAYGCFGCLWKRHPGLHSPLLEISFFQGSGEINSIALKGVPIFGGKEIFFLTSDNRLRTKFP